MLQSRFFNSPAKVNLFFCVLGKHIEGLHEIYSVMSTLDFFDTLSFSPASSDQFLSNKPHLKNNHSNLVVRARDLWRKYSGIISPIKIELKKNIPLGSGLAGGSSNAATTLWALNEIYDHPLCIETLKHLAVKLGSDVSFFFSSGLSLVSKQGQQVDDLDLPFSKTIHLFLSEDIHSSTKDVFLNLNEFSTFYKASTLLKKFKCSEIVIHNDLLKPALNLYPGLHDRYLNLLKTKLHKN